MAPMRWVFERRWFQPPAVVFASADARGWDLFQAHGELVIVAMCADAPIVLQ
jgi:hypothetical protein